MMHGLLSPDLGQGRRPPDGAKGKGKKAKIRKTFANTFENAF
jgi:hypothetical protein